MWEKERWAIQKLDGSYWMTWKFQMWHMLLDRELWGLVEGSEMSDADSSEGRQIMFKRSSQKALTALIMAMFSTQIVIVQSWWCLEKTAGHFEKGALASKLHLRKRYFWMEMAGGTRVENTPWDEGVEWLACAYCNTHSGGRAGSDTAWKSPFKLQSTDMLYIVY